MQQEQEQPVGVTLTELVKAKVAQYIPVVKQKSLTAFKYAPGRKGKFYILLSPLNIPVITLPPHIPGI